MYAADPFAALQMVRNRQEKVAQRKEAGSRPSGSKQSTISSMHSDTPEVKMAALLRVKVEKAIKEVNPALKILRNDKVLIYVRDLLCTGTIRPRHWMSKLLPKYQRSSKHLVFRNLKSRKRHYFYLNNRPYSESF